MKCKRCEKNNISMGTAYPKHFAMPWGRLTITLSNTHLCEACIDALFSKINASLWKDKA